MHLLRSSNVFVRICGYGAVPLQFACGIKAAMFREPLVFIGRKCLGFFARIKTAWKVWRSTEKCNGCAAKQSRDDMQRVQLTKEFRLPLPLLIARNLLLWIMGYKPDHINKRAWLFGHGLMNKETRKVMRWVCFDCYICLLTPPEYESFRSAHFHDMIVEEGQEAAEQRLAQMDAIYSAREEPA